MDLPRIMFLPLSINIAELDKLLLNVGMWALQLHEALQLDPTLSHL